MGISNKKNTEDYIGEKVSELLKTQKNKKSVKGPDGRRIVKIFAVAAAVLVVIFLITCIINRWNPQITGSIEENVVTEYGDTFEPAVDIKGITKGTLFFKNGFETKVKTVNPVNTSKIGEYTVKYSTGFLFWKKTVKQSVSVVDTKAPVITLDYKDGYVYTTVGEYAEEGYKAEDNYDGDITDKVVVSKEEWQINYTVTDSSGNETVVSRVIKDMEAPVITLEGEDKITLQAGNAYDEPGWTAVDSRDGDVSENVAVTGNVNVYVAGSYELVYEVSDEAGNVAQAVRTVVVEPASVPEVIVPSGKVIYLTFDDGPHPTYTRRLLSILDKYDVKATFFVTNTGATEVIKEEYAAGHSIAIHTASHDYDYIYASEENYMADLNKMSDVIYGYTGKRTKLLRFPGGSSNGVSKFNPGIMSRLSVLVQNQGYVYFDWNVSSGDAGGATTADEVFNNVTEGVAGKDVSIVLQHDIKSFSVDAVERIIVWGLNNGYTFLPLTENSPTAHHRINN